MIAIAQANYEAGDSKPPGLSFRAATAEKLSIRKTWLNAILGFNYLDPVRDLPDTLRDAHTLLEDGGLLITKTACLSGMSISHWLALPAARLVGKAPFAAFSNKEQLAE
ncbi:hypothetical protein S40288_11462 [Stachybotrys chartarum IBT 40288]|nr:hypothetical protein S40288_11462 [Stachybotrys chartarum IBT 40288]